MKIRGGRALALAMVSLAGGCGAPGGSDQIGEGQYAGTLSQGTLSQGTLSQGTLSQGTLSQGTQNAVWQFSTTGWVKAGMNLTSTSVVRGRLSGKWGKTDPCGTSDHRITRSCDWYGGGWASCTPGTTMTIGAGSCGLGSSTVDTMLRVCAGKEPCRAERALASADGPAAGRAA